MTTATLRSILDLLEATGTYKSTLLTHKGWVYVADTGVTNSIPEKLLGRVTLDGRKIEEYPLNFNLPEEIKFKPGVHFFVDGRQ